MIYPEPIDHFDRLPDPILLLIFNMIGDVKALGCCSVVSRRFHSLVPEVDNVVVRVDCVISDDDSSSSSSGSSNKSRHPISSLFRLVLSGLLKPFQSITQFISISPRRGSSSSAVVDGDDFDKNSVTHHSPTQVLKNFNEIKLLRIELPSGELGIDEGVLLKWRADFGSTLDNCIILGASSVIQPVTSSDRCSNLPNMDGNGENDNGSIPDSFYTNGGLKLRVFDFDRCRWARSVVYELGAIGGAAGEALSASSASKRTLVPALNMRLWYAAHLELPDGTVLKGATLVAIRPSEQPKKEVVGSDGNWIADAFEEPYGTAARMLVKRRTYCLEMNSF
ncbi:hypothetical protein RND71_033709 [Anisodus tanguticus]|uniref:F-box domain-containing protein n=1 Tax=Anisodus tanguticus TaxID=243964 RepID=A0AAE1R934_9SOLA|nr:hypothetical protein RND71_033709 [Anisodus tanguticus]